MGSILYQPIGDAPRARRVDSGRGDLPRRSSDKMREARSKGADMLNRFPVVAAAVVLVVAGVARGAETPSETEKIEALIKAVEGMKDAKFVRNGTEHDWKAAAAHMRRKWKSAEKDVRTARDFIRLAATKSDTSGEKYLIRFKDGKDVESGKWLGERLDEIEKGKS